MLEKIKLKLKNFFKFLFNLIERTARTTEKLKMNIFSSRKMKMKKVFKKNSKEILENEKVYKKNSEVKSSVKLRKLI